MNWKRTTLWITGLLCVTALIITGIFLSVPIRFEMDDNTLTALKMSQGIYEPEQLNFFDNDVVRVLGYGYSTTLYLHEEKFINSVAYEVVGGNSDFPVSIVLSVNGKTHRLYEGDSIEYLCHLITATEIFVINIPRLDAWMYIDVQEFEDKGCGLDGSR